MSAEPEVVYSTATDPSRVSGWLPAPLHRPPAAAEPGISARWQDDAGAWRAFLRIEDTPVGGTIAVLEMSADGLDDGGLVTVVERALVELDREVADNFTAG